VPDPFLSQIYPAGAGGLDLKRALEEINPLKAARLTNLSQVKQEGSLVGRPGLTTLATAGTNVHSIGRLNDPSPTNPTYQLVVGADTSLYMGTSGALTQVDTGYSGYPLTLAQYHPPISDDTWMYIADSARMRKVRASDQLSLPIGFPPPPGVDNGFRIDEFKANPDGTVGAIFRTQLTCIGFNILGATVGGGTPGELTSYGPFNDTIIDLFTDATGWSPNNGTGGSTSAPTTDTTHFPPIHSAGAASVDFTTSKAGTTTYYNFWGKATSVDLNYVGNVTSSDDDLVHLWFACDLPQWLVEARLYLVISPNFDPGTLPGTDASGTFNTDAYVMSISPSNFAGQIALFNTAGSTSVTTVATVQTAGQLPTIEGQRPSTEVLSTQISPSIIKSTDAGPGALAWWEIGVIGLPLHRGDFQRIGTNPNASWGTVTGLVVAVQGYSGVTGETPTNFNCWFQNCYMFGGSGPDTSPVGDQPYDYRYTYYDPRTGAEGNPSPIQAPGFRLDALRQSIVITPTAYGDPNIRQRFYRRGGTLNSAWFFLGVNSGDGLAFTDMNSDDDIVASNQLALDNDQPVTSTDAAGNPVYAQPIPAIWGPLSDILFGCGDPNQPGVLYWTKPTNLDAWPAANFVEVCPPSEELMNGAILAGTAFCMSRERGFQIIANLQAANTVLTLPTACTHGIWSRWGICAGAGLMFFVAKDGIYSWGGTIETSISDADIRGLFHGEVRNGYNPIDFTHPEMVRLQVQDNELWFQYQDTSGATSILIYSILYQFWRPYLFGPKISTIYAQQAINPTFGAPLSMLLGGKTTGKLYTHSGTSDDGAAISARFTTGALDQGLPREDKLYGDVMIDAAPNGANMSITTFYNEESLTGPTNVITGTGLQRFYVDPSSGTDQPPQARNISIDVQWSTTGTSPILHRIGPSYNPQPSTSTARVTNWDEQGRISDKWVKGIAIECDTFGVSKTVNVYADNANTGASFTLSAATRQCFMFSWAQFRGRIIRLVPVDTVPWKVYAIHWIFDEEPLALTRWETQPVDHGLPGPWQKPLYGHISVLSFATVTLEVDTIDQQGNTTQNFYTVGPVGGSAGVKAKYFVPFNASKGTLFKYIFTSAVPFYVYREESSVYVIPWGGQQAQPVKPFGNDDLDLVRSIKDAGLVAQRDAYGFAQTYSTPGSH
jgi:hypothetical protein